MKIVRRLHQRRFKIYNRYNSTENSHVDAEIDIHFSFSPESAKSLSLSLDSCIRSFRWLHFYRFEISLSLALSLFRVGYCQAIDFMAGVTNIFRIKFRPAALAARVPRTWTLLPVREGRINNLKTRVKSANAVSIALARASPPINPRVLSS